MCSRAARLAKHEASRRVQIGQFQPEHGTSTYAKYKLEKNENFRKHSYFIQSRVEAGTTVISGTGHEPICPTMVHVCQDDDVVVLKHGTYLFGKLLRGRIFPQVERHDFDKRTTLRRG